MDKNFRTTAPFGVSTKRFARIGYHPSLDVTGALKREVTKAGPGSYNLKPMGCISQKDKMSPWQRKMHTEEWSSHMGYKHSDIINEREFRKTLGGPAVLIVDEEIFKKKSNSIRKNAGFGISERFHEFEDIKPPPDTYFRDLKKHSTIPPRTMSQLPHFEWDMSRRFKENIPDYQLAANRYNVPDFKDMSAVANKVVSNKRPLDFFTGPRDYKNIKNHFAERNFTVPENTCKLVGGLDYLLKNHNKKRIITTKMDKNFRTTAPFGVSTKRFARIGYHPSLDVTGALKREVTKAGPGSYNLKPMGCISQKDKINGKFLKAERWLKKPVIRVMLTDLSLCYKNPKDPSPATYHTETYLSIKKEKESKYPFNQSNVYARPPTKYPISPAVGRYTPTRATCKFKNRKSWVFLTHRKIKIETVEDYTAF